MNQNQNPTPAQISISTEGVCANHRACYNLASQIKYRKKWIAENDLFVDIDGRVFARVMCKFGTVFMDAITGSLYKDGVGIASQNLLLRDAVRNRERASRILLSIQVVR